MTDITLLDIYADIVYKKFRYKAEYQQAFVEAYERLDKLEKHHKNIVKDLEEYYDERHKKET